MTIDMDITNLLPKQEWKCLFLCKYKENKCECYFHLLIIEMEWNVCRMSVLCSSYIFHYISSCINGFLSNAIFPEISFQYIFSSYHQTYTFFVKINRVKYSYTKDLWNRYWKLILEIQPVLCHCRKKRRWIIAQWD